jgi:hypothetical protein
MNRSSRSTVMDFVNQQGARALLSATFEFLQANNVPKRFILGSIRQNYRPRETKGGVRQYRRLVRDYEDMGIVMSTWFSLPRFLDNEYRPKPLTTGRGLHSVTNLVRASRVSISASVATELMHRSPSIRADAVGNLVPQRREFVLPGFTVPRAALVIERYLDTLRRNSSPNKRKGILLLERNCYVPEVNLETIAPVLRDIKMRGSAYIDSVNGDIEGLRLKRPRRNRVGEMSVHIFAWTRLSKARKRKSNP